MADLLLLGRLVDARRARPRCFRCFNAHCYFWFARKASRKLKLKLTYYFSSIVAQLLKLSTICKSPLHGHATMLTTRGNDRLITVHASTTVSNNFFANFPTIFRFSKTISPYNLQQSTSHWTASGMVFRVHVYTDTEKFRPRFTPFTRQPARIALNFPPNLFVRWESLCWKIYS